MKQIYITERRFELKLSNSLTKIKNEMFSTWRDFKKKFVVGAHMINEAFGPKISSIFHIEWVNDGRISQILVLNHFST